MPCFSLGLDAQAAGQRWFRAVRTEVEEQEGGWSLLSGDRADAGPAQSGSCGDREGTDTWKWGDEERERHINSLKR